MGNPPSQPPASTFRHFLDTISGGNGIVHRTNACQEAAQPVLARSRLSSPALSCCRRSRNQLRSETVVSLTGEKRRRCGVGRFMQQAVDATWARGI